MTESTRLHTVVLVIEDDSSIRTLLVDALTEDGYSVVAAANGSEAMGVLSTVWPDLVTLDLNLPDTSGEWLLKKIHEQDTSRKPPVIIITAQLTIAPDVRKLAQAIVPKPFELDELLQMIRDFIPPPEREHA